MPLTDRKRAIYVALFLPCFFRWWHLQGLFMHYFVPNFYRGAFLHEKLQGGTDQKSATL